MADGPTYTNTYIGRMRLKIFVGFSSILSQLSVLFGQDKLFLRSISELFEDKIQCSWILLNSLPLN
jgi:hypothetical protein